MTSLDPLPDERETPERVVEYEESWTLVPDDLAESGWAVFFDDGSLTRSWLPEGAL